MIVHGGLVAASRGGRWFGALITGPSGSGKSDLALRLFDEGFALAADDRVLLWRSGDKVYGRAPDALSDLMEIRGLGVRHRFTLPFAPVSLIVALHPADKIDRVPEPEREHYFKLSIPAIKIAGFEPSAPAKLRYALMALG